MVEYLDIVNEQDEVIGQASEAEIYAKHLPHRIVHILVYNAAGEMALHLRSAQDSFCPLHWTTAAGGHVRAGETPEQAAARELYEELGIVSPLEFFAKDIYRKGQLVKILTTYRARWNDSFQINSGEVQRVEFFSMDRLRALLESRALIHPELTFLLQQHKDKFHV